MTIANYLKRKTFYLEPKNGLFVLIVYSSKFFSTTTHVKENYFKLSTGIEKCTSHDHFPGKILRENCQEKVENVISDYRRPFFGNRPRTTASFLRVVVFAQCMYL